MFKYILARQVSQKFSITVLFSTAPTRTTPSAASGQRCGWRSPPAGCAWPCTSGPWWPPWSSPTETSADLPSDSSSTKPNYLHSTQWTGSRFSPTALLNVYLHYWSFDCWSPTTGSGIRGAITVRTLLWLSCIILNFFINCKWKDNPMF